MKKNILSFGKFSLCVVLSAFMSRGAYSQSTASLADTPADNKMLKKELNKPLKQALSEIEAQHNAFIIYNLQSVENKFVSGKATEGERIEESLETLLTPLHLNFEKISENVYVIILPGESKPNHSGQTQREAMEALQAMTGGPSRIDLGRPKAEKAQFKVTGRVTTRGGEALPGVNVVVKGTAVGTSTGVDGSYTIDAPDGNATLVFSYIGFLNK